MNRLLKQNFLPSKTVAFSKWNYPTFSTLRQKTSVKKTSYPQGINDMQMWNKRIK